MAGIYIHIPFCKSKCRYCDFTSYPSKLGFAEAYMACLYKEMKLRAAELQDKQFDTVYFGGGTPSIIDEKLIVGCMNQIKKYYHLFESAEVTIELNPGTVSKEKIEAYKRAGINRFSVGLQVASDALLEEIGRVHTVSDFEETCKLLGEVNFSADIMIGLKGETFADVETSIRLVQKYGAKHVSMYALTPEDGTPIYSDYLNGDLPDADEVAELYGRAYKLLESLGYKRYEVSNFAVPGYESKHNLNYWRRGEYIGFGVAASSFMKNRRFTNTRDLDDYIKCILTDFYPVVDNEEISKEDAKFEKVMLALRTERGLNMQEYKSEFGSDFASDFFAALKKNRNYLELEGNFVRIKADYMYVQNRIISDFLQ